MDFIKTIFKSILCEDFYEKYFLLSILCLEFKKNIQEVDSKKKIFFKSPFY